ncbi:MAG: glycosyl hydrolase, partial [Limisphaerales bacterium]
MKQILSACVVPYLLLSCFTANALEPANPNANPKARAILNYLQALGARPDKRLVSGQFAGFGPGTNLRLMDQIHERTGQWPALMGTDYADFGHGSLTYESPNQAAIQY